MRTYTSLLTIRTYLFNLNADLRESTYLTRYRPKIAESMFNELKSYLESVGTKFPIHNPDYNPASDGGLLSVAPES